MTRAAARHSGSRRKHRAGAERAGINEGALLVVVLMVGAFGVYLGSLLTGGEWRGVLGGYLWAVAAISHYFGWRAYLGGALQSWQQAFARLPLRPAGYGGRRGKPLVEAQRDPRARAVLIVSSLASAALLALISWALLAP